MEHDGMGLDGPALGLTGFDHHTLRCRHDEIAGLIRPHREVLGLRPGTVGGKVALTFAVPRPVPTPVPA